MEWFRRQYQELRPHAKWELLKALMIAALYPLLVKLRHASWDWWVFGGIFVVSFFVLAFVGRKDSSSQHSRSSSQSTTAVVPAVSTVFPGVPGPTFDSKEFFKHAYYSPVTAEAEKNIRTIAERDEPSNPMGFICRIFGVGLVGYLHDFTWITIYQSQFRMLSDMNASNGWMTLADAKKHYDNAALQHPETYKTYAFTQWLNYIKGRQLLIEHPSKMLEITVQGKDFLKYLTHWGRVPINAKA